MYGAVPNLENAKLLKLKIYQEWGIMDFCLSVSWSFDVVEMF